MSEQRSTQKKMTDFKASSLNMSQSDPSLDKLSDREMQKNSSNMSKRHKRDRDEGTEASPSPLKDIESMISELKRQQDIKFNSLSEALSLIVNQNQDIRKAVDFMSNQYDELLSKINNLEQENSIYKSKISVLENRVENLEKDCRSSCLEIRNIPKSNNENKGLLTEIVKKVSSTISVEPPLQFLEFRDIFRTKTEAIVVNFTTTSRKESMMTSYFQFNKTRRQSKSTQLNTELINIPGTSRPIFISEVLTAKSKRLFYLAREQVKNKMLTAAWTSYGKVYVKKEEGLSRIRIEDEADLHKLIK